MQNKVLKFTLLILAIICAIALCIFFQFQVNKNNEEINSLTTQNKQLSIDIDNRFDKDLQLAQDYEREYQIIDDVDKAYEKVTDTDKRLINLETDYGKQSEMRYINTTLNDIFARTYSFDERPIDELEDGIITESTDIATLQNTKENITKKAHEITADLTGDEYLSLFGVDSEFTKLFDSIYPVGSIYISINGEVPLRGTWQSLTEGTTLWNGESEDGSLLEATLPNIVSDAGASARDIGYGQAGACQSASQGSKFRQYNNSSHKNHSYYTRRLDFSTYNPVYQNGATVRPPSIGVTIFKRVS